VTPRPKPSPPARPNPLSALALKGKLGLILVGAIALIGLRPLAERLWEQVTAPGVERALGGAGFPVDQAQLVRRMDHARGQPVGSVWHAFEEGGQSCRRLKAVAQWTVCDLDGRPASITAVIAGPAKVDPARELGVLIDVAARGGDAAGRKAALALVADRKGGAVTIGDVRITALPGRIDGWVLDARPVGAGAKHKRPSPEG
jgi:hypothetical protein